MVRRGAKLFWTKTWLIFASKALSNSFFQKTRFRFEFLYKIAPHLFSWPNGLNGAIGGKSLLERSFVHPKKHVFGSNFFMKPAPYLFSGSNWLYGAFGGKIVPDENFAQFCLKSDENQQALNGLIQDIWADSTTGHSKLGPKEDEGVINLIQAADGADHA